MAGHAGEHRDVRAGTAQRCAPAGPPAGRQMMRRVDQEAGRARIGERGEVLAPPRGQRVARGFIAEVRVGDIRRVRGAARIDQRVVVRALDVPVRMLGAQRVLARPDPARLRAAGAARGRVRAGRAARRFRARSRLSRTIGTAGGNRLCGAESRRCSRPRTRRRAHDRSPCRRHARTSAATRRAARRGGRRRSRGAEKRAAWSPWRGRRGGSR